MKFITVLTAPTFHDSTNRTNHPYSVFFVVNNRTHTVALVSLVSFLLGTLGALFKNEIGWLKKNILHTTLNQKSRKIVNFLKLNFDTWLNLNIFINYSNCKISFENDYNVMIFLFREHFMKQNRSKNVFRKMKRKNRLTLPSPWTFQN